MEGIGRLVAQLASPTSNHHNDAAAISEGSEVNIVVTGKVIASAKVLRIGGPYHNREVGSDFVILHSLHILDMQSSPIAEGMEK